MYDMEIFKTGIIFHKEIIMNVLEVILDKILIFEKEPQKIGLSQLKEPVAVKQQEPSISSKNVKLSDLMRRAS